jgi:uncharacterized protein (TIGR02145 family)
MKKTIAFLFILSYLFTTCTIDKEPENNPPTCIITSMETGEHYYNEGYEIISVNAEDIDGTITEVRFTINDVGVTSVNTFPYNYSWNMDGIPAGTYIIKATAYDDDGAFTDHSISITVVETPTDLYDGRDSTIYKTVWIGDKLWMAENLAYDNGSGTFVYNDNEANKAIYGYLYTWNTACDVCPDGWHLPIKGEWEEAIEYLGGSSVAGGAMKTTGTAYWKSPNSDATNSSGFSAYPGGKRKNYAVYYEYLRYNAYFWTASTQYNDEKYAIKLGYETDNTSILEQYDTYGLSVRCVKDY